MSQTSPTLLPEDRLRALLPRAIDPFSRGVMDGAARVLADRANPVRLNLFAVAMRMMFEHLMDHLAPDAEVEACGWYKPMKGHKKPVRSQAIQYCLQGGFDDHFLRRELRLDPAPLRKRLMSAFNKLSKHVHGRKNTVVTDLVRQDTEANVVLTAVDQMLTAYHGCRAALVEPLEESLDSHSVDTLMLETIRAIDELATHYMLEEVYTDSTGVVAIKSDIVRYRASGTVNVTLQWGSNSDLRRGDGALLSRSFPFECLFDVPIDDPRDLSGAQVVSGVDTSSWWDHEME